MVLPGFWIGAGEKFMEMDENGMHVLAMSDERLSQSSNRFMETLCSDRFPSAPSPARLHPSVVGKPYTVRR